VPSGPIASVQFTDGPCRLIYEDAQGQYFIDDAGEPVYGVWLVPREKLEALFGEQPLIVDGRAKPWP